MIQGSFLVFCFVFLTTSDDSLYQLVLHSHDRGAACLDGSPAGMYIHGGNGPNKDKFIMYFNGGGFCGADTPSQTIESCYQRSFTALGTTTVYNKTETFDGHGILSRKPEENPVFHDWTKIFVIYCDGSEHQGHRGEPISYKGRDLFFRGTRNSLQQFHYLDKQYDFYNKDTIVMTGVSAGGMATFQWIQYLYEHTKTSKVYGMPDSGLFLINYYSPIAKEKVVRIKAENILKLVNNDESYLPGPIRLCLQELNDLPSCFDASNYAKHIQAPLFLIQSPYDQWILKYLLVVQCVTNRHQPYSIENCNDTARAAIEDYRHSVIKAIYKVKGSRKDVGIWGPACIQHGFCDDFSFTGDEYKVPTTTGSKLFESVRKFLENPQNAPWQLDEGEWPANNTGCNGLEHLNLVRQ